MTYKQFPQFGCTGCPDPLDALALLANLTAHRAQSAWVKRGKPVGPLNIYGMPVAPGIQRALNNFISELLNLAIDSEIVANATSQIFAQLTADTNPNK